ncbi:SMB protein [Colletotrichum karsti]|uniref:Sm protein B n=1 Tax=Colletotrichum karsti TaxID=1095194 RepID=A0A9P6IBZ4_9PEZI|nr:SMB protein [Colletotrichum karsti]KAF9879699.1 SMB protein [Colletotrichum karsti]
MRVTLNDGRQMTGQMLAFDKHMNLVLADTEEFRRVKIKQNKPAAPGSSGSSQTIEKEEKRTLGLTIVRGAHIVSLSVESEPPADPSARLGKSAPGGISSTLAAGPGVARPAGRGAAPVPPSLAGPAAGVGGGAPPGFPGFPGAPPFGGRGGLFEGDVDLDFAVAINEDFPIKDFALSKMVHQTDQMAGPDMLKFYKSDEYRKELKGQVANVRKQLDAGLCDKIFEKYRPLEHEKDGQFRVILVGALMMRAGAKIKQDDLDHLKELADGMEGEHGFSYGRAFDILHQDEKSPLRYPGKVQFLTALENYKAGVPRDFGEPSCFNCGKIEADLGAVPKKCGKCGVAWFCNVDCQKEAWKNHKLVCKTRSEKNGMINV